MSRAIQSLIYLVNAPKLPDEVKDCICPRCPSYPDCAVEPYLRLFCLTKKAPCPVRRRGCMCPTCKVHTRHQFTRDFYCDLGTEEEQQRTIR